MLLVDAETFASLTVLNRHYHRNSSSKFLYAFHLAENAKNKKNLRQNWEEYRAQDLSSLKKSFARLAKRNLFAVYRPQLSTFQLEASAFSKSWTPSPGDVSTCHFPLKSTKLVIAGSSRLYVLDITGHGLQVRQSIILEQHPMAVEITEDGTTLALLSSAKELSIYVWYADTYKRTKHFLLDKAATTIAISPDGSLAVAAEESATVDGVCTLEFVALNDVPGMNRRRKTDSKTRPSRLVFVSENRLSYGMKDRTHNEMCWQAGICIDRSLALRDATAVADCWMSQRLKAVETMPNFAPQVGFILGSVLDDAPLFTSEDLLEIVSVARTANDNRTGSGWLYEVACEFLLDTLLVSVDGLETLIVAPLKHSDDVSPLEHSDDGVIDGRARCIKTSHHARQARWVDGSVKRNSYQQRAVSTSITNGRQHVEAGSTSEGTICVTYLDFGYHVETRNRDVTLNLSTMKSSDGPDDESISQDPTNTVQPRSSSLAASSPQLHNEHSDLTRSAFPDVGTSSSEIGHSDGSFLPFLKTIPAARGGTADSMRADVPQSIQKSVHNYVPDARVVKDYGDSQDSSDVRKSSLPPPADAQTSEDQSPHYITSSSLSEHPPSRTLPYASASTPNLLMHAGDIPEAIPRPRAQQRVRSAYDAARSSVVMGRQHLKRVFSGPLDAPATNEEKEQATPTSAPMTARSSRPRPKSMTLDTVELEPQPRRRSIIPRPVSFHSNTIFSSVSKDGPRPSAQRTTSQPLDRPSTPPSQITAPAQTDSPSLPSPSQVLSLHSRQASGSFSTARSRSGSGGGPHIGRGKPYISNSGEGPTAPRAALGAYRRNTGTAPVSPWASTTMLMRVAETPGSSKDERRYSMPLALSLSSNGNGRVVSAPIPPRASIDTVGGATEDVNNYTNTTGIGRPRSSSTTANADALARLQEYSLPSTPGTPAFDGANTATDVAKDVPRSARKTSRERNGAAPHSSRYATGKGKSRAGRLSTIQSVASLMSSGRSSSGGSRNRAGGTTATGTGAMQRNGSKRVGGVGKVVVATSANGNGSAVPASESVPISQGARTKALWGKWKRKFMESLEKV